MIVHIPLSDDQADLLMNVSWFPSVHPTAGPGGPKRLTLAAHHHRTSHMPSPDLHVHVHVPTMTSSDR